MLVSIVNLSIGSRGFMPTPARKKSILESLDARQNALVLQMIDEAGLLQDRVLTAAGMDHASANGLAKIDNLAGTLEKHADDVHPVRQTVLSGARTVAEAAHRQAKYSFRPEQRAGIGIIATSRGFDYTTSQSTVDWAAGAAKVALAAHVLAKDLPAAEAKDIFDQADKELQVMRKNMPDTVAILGVSVK